MHLICLNDSVQAAFDGDISLAETLKEKMAAAYLKANPTPGRDLRWYVETVDLFTAASAPWPLYPSRHRCSP